MTHTPTRVLIIGAGPRAVGILERLVANHDGTSLHIDLVDPESPGAGRIWRYEQSELLLMNSRAEDVTIFTDDSFTGDGPVYYGPSLSEWAAAVTRGEMTLDFPELADDVAAITKDSFASRRVHSCYMRWVYRDVTERLPEGVTLDFHRDTVVSLDKARGRYTARLGCGALIDADLAVISLGHTDAEARTWETQREDFAARHGLYYSRPAQTQDVDYTPLGPGRDVIVAGMGLAFIDLMALLFEGRGGQFLPDPTASDPARIRYVPSGAEPHLWVGSRRGVPFHSKISSSLKGEFTREPHFLTTEFFTALPDGFNFSADVLPRVIAELEYFVYREILTGHPEWSAMSWEEFAPAFDAAVRSGADYSELVSRAIPDASLHFDLQAYDRPFAGREFSSRDDVQDALVDYISEDLRLRTSPEHSETLALFNAFVITHEVLSRYLPTDRMDVLSHDSTYPGRWMSLYSLIGSGPPPHRLQQLLALHRAGYISFLGPEMSVANDEESGRFVARSAQSPDVVTADAYIDAFLPLQVAAGSANPLLAHLTSPDGLGRDSAGSLEVTHDFHLVDPDGERYERIWAVGRNTTEVPVGAFARPNTDSAAFRYNDLVARQVLTSAAQLQSRTKVRA